MERGDRTGGTVSGGDGRSLRTLLVGVDAACEGVLAPLFVEGELPTIWRLITEGANDRLASQVPPWTASAWPSLYTGTNPGKHGVFDFLTFDGYDWSVVTGSDVRTPALWEYLSAHDLSSVVVNVPVTHPPRPFDGALIPGYTAPEDPACHPSGLLADVRDAIGDYRVYPRHTGRQDASRDDVVAEHVALAGMRGEAFAYLAERFDPDFGFVQFQGTDSVVHELPADREALRAVYRAVDDAIASIVDRFEPTHVILASDHGIGPYTGYDVRVNEVLREAGYLTAVKGGRGMPTWATVRDSRLANGAADTGPRRDALARLTAAFARVGVTSQRAEAILSPLGLADPVARLLPTAAISAGTEQVDFPNSKAYMRSRVECGVRINLAGRDPNGLVSPDEYEAVRDDLVELFSGLRTPDGDRVFEAVGRREQFFDGPAVADAVDVVTVPADFDHFLSSRLAGDVFGAPTEPWNHKFDGVVAVTGPGIDPGSELADADLLDVAPTVLATFGVPAASVMDGRVLPVVNEHGVERYDEISRDRPQTAAQTDGSDSVEARLADLGYLE